MTRGPVTGANRSGKRLEDAVADMLDERRRIAQELLAEPGPLEE